MYAPETFGERPTRRWRWCRESRRGCAAGRVLALLPACVCCALRRRWPCPASTPCVPRTRLRTCRCSTATAPCCRPCASTTRVRRGPWLTLADISPALREAIVLSEDRRFWAHGGVDWRALAAGAWATAWNARTRGASTLTMQLAGLLDDDLARPAGGRSVGQKLTQMRRAQQLEDGWSKTQILEAYLNRVPLRGELVGVAAASQVLFGKHASGLDARRGGAAGRAWCAAPTPARRCWSAAPARCCASSSWTAAGWASRWPRRWRGGRGRCCRRSGEALAPHLARRMPRARQRRRGAARWTPSCSAWRWPRCAASWPSCAAARSRTAP